MDGRDIIRKPIVSEQSYVLIEENDYTFEVHPEATKPQIREAVEQIFGVRVTKVNTLNRKGKRKRNRKNFSYGKRSDQKRALVTVAEGDAIELFDVQGKKWQLEDGNQQVQGVDFRLKLTFQKLPKRHLKNH